MDEKSLRKFEEEVIQRQERYEQIKELAMSTLQEMTKLEFNHNEYEHLKSCMDDQIKNSRISLS